MAKETEFFGPIIIENFGEPIGKENTMSELRLITAKDENGKEYRISCGSIWIKDPTFNDPNAGSAKDKFETIEGQPIEHIGKGRYKLNGQILTSDDPNAP